METDGYLSYGNANGVCGGVWAENFCMIPLFPNGNKELWRLMRAAAGCDKEEIGICALPGTLILPNLCMVVNYGEVNSLQPETHCFVPEGKWGGDSLTSSSRSLHMTLTKTTDIKCGLQTTAEKAEIQLTTPR